MNDNITVAELLDSKRLSNEDIQKLCKGLSFRAYQLLISEKYNPDLNINHSGPLTNILNRINVNIDDFSEVSFNNEAVINNETKPYAKFLSTEFIAVFTVALYMPDYSYRRGLLNKEVLAHNFSVYEDLLPVKDVDYYRSVIVDSMPLFYGEHEKTSNNIVDQSVGRGYAYVKKTNHQEFVEEGNPELQNLKQEEYLSKMSGFSGTVFLAVLFTTTSLLMIALVLYFVH